MADSNNAAQTQTQELDTNYVYENRRYVGTKESVGFIIWDAAQSFNINIFNFIIINWKRNIKVHFIKYSTHSPYFKK